MPAITRFGGVYNSDDLSSLEELFGLKGKKLKPSEIWEMHQNLVREIQSLADEENWRKTDDLEMNSITVNIDDYEKRISSIDELKSLERESSVNIENTNHTYRKPLEDSYGPINFVDFIYRERSERAHRSLPPNNGAKVGALVSLEDDASMATVQTVIEIMEEEYGEKKKMNLNQYFSG